MLPFILSDRTEYSSLLATFIPASLLICPSARPPVRPSACLPVRLAACFGLLALIRILPPLVLLKIRLQTICKLLRKSLDLARLHTSTAEESRY